LRRAARSSDGFEWKADADGRVLSGYFVMNQVDPARTREVSDEIERPIFGVLGGMAIA
jgi:hypothetical protein